LKLLPRLDAASVRRLFFAAFGLIHVAAFASLAVQIVGLVGEHGILPVGEFLRQYEAWGEQSGRLADVKHAFPTFCWWSAGDAALRAQCGAGVVLGLLLFLGVAPLLVLPCLWALYLSLTVAGQEFLQFQWDTLLLETTFFSIWFAPGGLLPWGPPRWLLLKRRRPEDPVPAPPTSLSRFALRLLLFRFMFASGYVKLSFGDRTWRELTALTFHYWTQPLPTPLGWYAHQISLPLQKLSCAAMFVVELAVPWLLFAGRLGRNLFGLATIGLMVGIGATGNYGFFEPLTIALALLLLERRTPASKRDDGGAVPRERHPSELARVGRVVGASIAAGAALLGLIGFGAQLVRPRLKLEEGSRLQRPIDLALDAVEWLAAPTDEPEGEPRPRLAALHEWLAPYRTFNTYGLFRVMTTTREEIVVEGSDDGKEWRAYEFRDKPGDPSAPPCLCQPHMPRLDWQMWFAAFGPPPEWFHQFVQRLLEGEPSVLSLLEKNPFPDHPPEFVRALLYDYRFATLETRRATGDWWFRRESRPYLRPVSSR